MRHHSSAYVGWACTASLTLLHAGPAMSETQGLLLFDPGASQSERVTITGWMATPGPGVLRLQPEGDKPAELQVTAPEGGWDLSAYDALQFTVHNRSDVPITLHARADGPDAKNSMDSCRAVEVIMPEQSSELTLRLMPRPEDPGYEVFRPFMMYYEKINVRDNTVVPSFLARVAVWIEHPSDRQQLELGAIRATGQGRAEAPTFFPFVDRYGQYIHTDWPGKVYSDDDFTARRQEEEQERAHWPGPPDWNVYGGWAKGPQLEATGFFYPVKHKGKWWLVDPGGRLFWSHGPTGVGFGGDTSPITDREHWFARLPRRDDPRWGQYYREGHGATYRYYADKDVDWVGYDFATANVHRKYGEDYDPVLSAISNDRLRSWGFNTIANWSSAKVYLQRRTPYTVPIHYDSPLIHYRLPDIYHPDWEPAVRERMEREKNRTAGDPWNIGYFVDNARWWGWRARAAAIGEVALTNPTTSHTKKRFMELLRGKYEHVDRLNEAWGTNHASWDALFEGQDKPDMKNKSVEEDCGDLGMMYAERYFSIVRDTVKAVAPDNLYLGVRFHGHIDPEIVKLAARYCDVISYNIYDNPPDGRVNQYRALDVPILASEWGVESDPRLTPFRGEDLSTDPEQRARLYSTYVERAIRHPNVIGAHFFQYRDQPLSGRPDGEAVLRGLVNITDTPNFTLIEANRRIAYDLYETRYNAD